MYQHKLLQILGKMPIKEVKKFQKYFEAEYPNRLVEQDILQQLLKVHPAFGDHKKEQELLYKKIFPEHFNNKRRSKELGKLARQLETYLLLKKLQSSGYEKDLMLLHIYKEYGLKDLFIEKASHLNKGLSQKEEQDQWFWNKKIRVAHEGYFNTYINHFKSGPDLIYQALEDLENYHLASFLGYACELYSRYNILKEEKPNLPDLDKNIEKALASNSVYHQCYALLLQLIIDGEDETYFSLKKKAINNLAALGAEDQNILLTYLCNFIAKRVREGNQDFLLEQFELMKVSIPLRIFITDGHFNPTQFMNIVDTGCKLKKHKWTDEFIKSWSPFLKTTNKKDVLDLTHCMCLFSRKAFKKADAYLSTLRPKNILLEIQVRCIWLQTNFELKEFQIVENQLESFKVFINRRKDLQEAHKQGALTTIHFIKELIKLNPKKQQLIKALNAATYILQKSWIKEKIMALK